MTTIEDGDVTDDVETTTDDELADEAEAVDTDDQAEDELVDEADVDEDDVVDEADVEEDELVDEDQPAELADEIEDAEETEDLDESDLLAPVETEDEPEVVDEVEDEPEVLTPVEPVDTDEDAAGLVVPAVAATKPTWRQHRAEMKASARRVRRVVRHIDTWSVFKVASIFVVCVWGVIVLASLLIWRAAVSSGSVDNTEEFIVDLGFQDFNFNPQQMFEALLSAGAVLAIASIFFIVLLTVLFNLICDMTGGVRVTMIEQDVADARKKRS